MKVTVNTIQTLIELDEVPVGSCVRLASRANDEIYMRIDNPVDSRYEMVRLNDGLLKKMTCLPGYHWELVEAEVVVHD